MKRERDGTLPLRSEVLARINQQPVAQSQPQIGTHQAFTQPGPVARATPTPQPQPAQTNTPARPQVAPRPSRQLESSRPMETPQQQTGLRRYGAPIPNRKQLEQRQPARKPVKRSPPPEPATPQVDIFDNDTVLEVTTHSTQITPITPVEDTSTRLPLRGRRVDRPHNIITPITLEPPPLPNGVCPICRGAGYLRVDVPVGHPAFGKAAPCECKEREIEQKRREALWRLSSLDAFQEMTFENFNARVAGTKEAWEVARAYAQDPEGWLLFSGQCGSGKTHLAAAIANIRFQQGDLVLFAVVPKLLDHLRAAFAPTSATPYDALFDKVCEAGLLVLDDLGAEHTTPWAQEKLFQIINHRYMYQLPTVITTNLELINDIDDRVRSRLTDISLVRHVRISAKDYRPNHTTSRQTTRERG